MNTRDAIFSLMAAASQFADLDPMTLRTIAARCRPKVFLTGQMVFMEGDPCRNLCILASGRVKFFRMNAEGREQILKVFERPGDMFCIASAFSTGIHIVSARAMTETRLHLLDMDAVNRLAREHPSVGLKMVGTAAEHMTHLVALADDLSLKTATGRLAKYLYELAVAEGAGKGVKVRVARDRLRAEELASLLGTVRVHISRSLASLADAGAIDLDRRFIRIRDLAILRRFFEGK
jgi:CRP/FNR family transcriptional regulator, dissimilatory nitrate respiration regulator